MRVMILGAGGMLGRDLVGNAPSGATTHPFTRSELDITNTDLLSRTVADVRPDVVINAAAYTQVDRAEAEPEVAFRVNAEAVGALGAIATGAGARVLHVSTDYVFDGEAAAPYTEESAPCPISVYGASKLAGETALQQSGADFLIVRTQWLFGVHGRSFPRTMWERARAGSETKVVNDQVGRPTYTTDLARAIWTLTERGARGVLHVANRREATWFEVAKRIFAHVGRSELLRPCVTAEYPTPARRPRHSVLGTARAEQELGGGLRDWAAALDRFLSLLAN